MNASSSDVVAPASTELTTPANSTAKATTVIDNAASTVDRDTSVPRQTSTAPGAPKGYERRIVSPEPAHARNLGALGAAGMPPGSGRQNGERYWRSRSWVAPDSDAQWAQQ